MVSKAHWVLSLTFATVLFVSAPYIADILFYDIQLTPYIRLSAFIIPITSYLSVHLGSLNGMRLFGKHAVSTSVFGLSRLLMVIFFVILGFGLYGVMLGLITASLLGLATAMYLYPRPNHHDGGSLSHKKMISFAVSVTISVSSITLITNIDLLATKAFSSFSSAGKISGRSRSGKKVCKADPALRINFNASVLSYYLHLCGKINRNFLLPGIPDGGKFSFLVGLGIQFYGIICDYDFNTKWIGKSRPEHVFCFIFNPRFRLFEHLFDSKIWNTGGCSRYHDHSPCWS
jgi:hypothetical protein